MTPEADSGSGTASGSGSATARTVDLVVDGRAVEVPDDGADLLHVLREQLGLRAPKDGCSPQGQCGCCTVLVDGQPRVACVTPVRRVRGRTITTLDGLDPDERTAWADAFCATGASQCGFCTPGIVMRLSALRAKGTAPDDTAAVEQGLLAHLCRCTGWRTILDAWQHVDLPTSAGSSAAHADPAGTAAGTTGPQAGDTAAAHPPAGTAGATGTQAEHGLASESPASPRGSAMAGAATVSPSRDVTLAGRRAEIEGRGPQRVGPDVSLGRGGFADDTAPADALVAMPDGAGGWSVGETLREARAGSGKVQGRRTTVAAAPPLELPPGEWDVTLRTSWVEPAYLETDASWCVPGGEPATPLANGGAFGGKMSSVCAAAARQLADRHGRPVRVLLPREDAVRLGPKRPPIAAGVRADGTGVVRVVRTPGIAAAIAHVAPDLEVEEVDIPGPPTSIDLRAAGWAEALILLAATRHPAAAGDPRGLPSPAGVDQHLPHPGPDGIPRGEAEGTSEGGDERLGGAAAGEERGDHEAEVTITSPDGATARAHVVLGEVPRIDVRVRCGEPLDEVVLRSYCVGAAHMGLSWVCREGLTVDDQGTVHDLTIRSFGVLRAVDMPPVDVTVEPDDRAPVNGSDAVFVAVAAATWLAQGLPTDWPTGHQPRRR